MIQESISSSLNISQISRHTLWSIDTVRPIPGSHRILFRVRVFCGKVNNRRWLWKYKTQWRQIEIGFWPRTHKTLSDSIRKQHYLRKFLICCHIICFYAVPVSEISRRGCQGKSDYAGPTITALQTMLQICYFLIRKKDHISTRCGLTSVKPVRHEAIGPLRSSAKATCLFSIHFLYLLSPIQGCER